MVHSDLDHHGFTHALIDFARESGAAAYTGDGSNVWPAANTYDIGVLYRLALEKAPAGSTLHGVGDTGIPRKLIAETIAGKLGIEAKSITDEEAPQYLGFLAAFAGLDNPTSNDKTRDAAGLGADPSGLGRGRGDGPLLRLITPALDAMGAEHARLRAALRLQESHALAPARPPRRAQARSTTSSAIARRVVNDPPMTASTGASSRATTTCRRDTAPSSPGADATSGRTPA